MPGFLKKGKIIVYILILIFILFFTMDFGAIDLQKVAVVVTLGLDYDKTASTYTLSGQVVSSTGGDTSKQDQAVIKGIGETPSMALKNMEDNSGWHPYISFCKLIVLSKSVFENDIINVLDFFIRSEKLSDTAVICATEEKAEDVLTSKTALDDISTFALLKSLLYNADKNMNVISTSLKDFTVNYYNTSNGNILSFIKTIPEDEPADALDDAEEPSQDSSKISFDTTGAAIFRKEKLAGFLTADETKAYNIITKKTKFGQMDVKDVQTTDYYIKNCSLELTNTSFNKKINFDKDTITCKITVNADFKINHLESEDKNLNNVIYSMKIPDELKTALSKKIQSSIEEMLDKIKSYDSDIFEIEENLFRFHPKKYKNFKKNNPEKSIIQNTDFDIKIKLKAVSN